MINNSKNKKYYIFQINSGYCSLLSILIFAILIVIFYLINDDFVKTSFLLFNNPMIYIIMILYLVFHEIIHSISYIIFGGKYKKIVYGVAIEQGILYCLCKQNISKKNILNSLLAPFVLIGLLTGIIGWFCKLPLLFLLSIINISGCSADIMMFLYLIKLKNIEFTEFDDPISFGIYTNEEVNLIKHPGLKFVKITDNVKREDYKKINITKLSKIILIIIFILLIINLLIT